MGAGFQLPGNFIVFFISKEEMLKTHTHTHNFSFFISKEEMLKTHTKTHTHTHTHTAEEERWDF